MEGAAALAAGTPLASGAVPPMVVGENGQPTCGGALTASAPQTLGCSERAPLASGEGVPGTGCSPAASTALATFSIRREEEEDWDRLAALAKKHETLSATMAARRMR